MAEEAAVRKTNRPSIVAATIWRKLFDAFYLYICMCLSGELVGNVLLGGAICLAGQVMMVYVRLYSARLIRYLPAGLRARGLVLLGAVALLMAALLFLYPALTGHPNFITMVLSIILLLARQAVTDVLADRLPLRHPILKVPLLFAAHTLFSAGLLLLVSPHIEAAPYSDIMTMVIATGVGALALQAIRTPRAPQSRVDTERLQRVSSYRVYNRMVSSVAMALNLTLLTYIFTADIDPVASLTDRFWDLIVWFVLVSGLTGIGLVFLRRRDITHYDKPTIFVVGAAILTIAIIGTHNNWFHGWRMVPGYLFWGAGLACILSIILSLGYDMHDVLELDMSDTEYKGYMDNTQIIIEWSMTLSMLLVLIMLTLMTFASEGTAELKSLPFVRFMMNTMTIWPVIFIGVAFVSAMMQPLNKDYAKKLAHFRSQQRAGNANPALQTRLQMKLVQQTRRILPGILRTIIRPLMPCRVIGKERVDVDNGPVVFVCNHLEIYGPLITNLHLPFYFRSWIISSMLDKEIIAGQLESGINVVFSWLPARLRQKLPHFFAPIALKILLSLDPIPVYRGTMREVIKTMQLTVDAMEYEDNILLFPENPGEEKYAQQGVSQFYSGFASIGSEYYKRTGNCTTFYPMYVNRQKRTLTIGDGIRYSPENGSKKEKERIVEALHSWMNEQGDD